MNINRIYFNRVLIVGIMVLLFAGLFVSFAYAAITLLTVTSPNGGEEWRGTQEITWTSDGDLGDLVTIVYSDDDFGSQSIIATDEPNDGTYDWDTTTSVFADPGATYKIRFIDSSLFVFDTSDAVFIVDNEDPVTTEVASPAIPDGLNGWYISVPDITLTCDDTSPPGSGCLVSGTFYDFDDITPTTVYTGAFAAPEGEHTLSYFSEDVAEDKFGAHNQEIVFSTVYKVDTIFPSVDSYLLDGGTESVWFNPAVAGTVDISITADEPVTWTTIRIKEVAGANYETKQPGTFGITGTTIWDGSLSTAGPLADGAYDLYYTIEDEAGNITGPVAGPLVSHQIIVDTSAPSIDDFSSPAADGVYKSTVPGGDATDALNFEVSDTGTGTLTCSYEIDSTTTTIETPCTNGVPVADATISGLTDGRHVIIFMVDDAAGNHAESSPVSFVFDNDGTLTVGSGSEDFSTIQKAIDEAVGGDSISVSAGIYTESLTVDKTLSIIGVGDTAILAPVQDSDGIAITADSVLIQDLKIVTSSSGTDTNIAIDIQGTNGVTISGTTIETTGNKAMGIWAGVTASTDLSILGNTITINNEATGIYGAKVSPAHSGWTIGGSAGNANTVNAYSNPVELYDVSASEVSHNNLTITGGVGSVVIWSSELSNLTDLVFNYNTVDYSGGSQVAFLADFQDSLIGLPGIPFLPDTTVTTVTVTGNTFDNWGGRGLRIGDGVTGVTASENKFLHDTGEALKNEDASEVSAENNYWGTAVLATIDTKTTGTIDHDPYWVNVEKTILSSTPVGTVYVDDSYSDGSSGSYYFGYDAFDLIQDGVSAVEAGGTVNVLAGTYTESVTVGKALTLSGVKVNVDPRGDAWTGDISTINAGEGNNGILVTASDVTINGFKITGSGTAGQVVDSNSGIYAFNGSTPLVNVTLSYNWLDANYGGGITVRDISNPIVEYNYLSNNGIGGSPNVAGIAGQELVNGFIRNNEVFNNNNYGIYLGTGGSSIGRGSSAKTTIGTTISSNEVHGNGKYGIQLIGLYGGDVEGIQVTGNNIHDNGRNGMKITNIKDSIIESNQITNNGAGGFATSDKYKYGVMLSAYSYGTPATGNQFEDNTFSGNALGSIYMAYGAVGSSEGSLANTVVLSNKFTEGFGKWGVNNTSSYTVNAEKNWWGDITGPLHSTNLSGAGASATDYVDFNPFCTDSPCTTFASADPIDHFDLDFNPTSALVYTDSILTVTAKDADNYTVVNDSLTEISLTADSGASFGDSLLTMDISGETTTTITNTVVSTVNVAALEVGGLATGTWQIEFTNSDVTDPSITDHSPLDNSTDVSINVIPYVDFSESLRATTVTSANIQLRKYDNSEVPATVALVEGGTRATITPDSPLEYETQYYFSVSSSVTDMVGRSLSNPIDSADKVSNEFTTVGIEPVVVDRIETVSNSAEANDSYVNGWHYVYYLTINTDETNLFIKFDDWLNTDGDPAHVVLANGNMRALFNSLTGSGMGSVVGLTDLDIENGYGDVQSFEIGKDYTDQEFGGTPMPMNLAGLDTSTASGVQIQFDVFTKLPVGTAAGVYETSYTLKVE